MSAILFAVKQMGGFGQGSFLEMARRKEVRSEGWTDFFLAQLVESNHNLVHIILIVPSIRENECHAICMEYL